MTKKINVIFESADKALARELWERGRAFITQTARSQSGNPVYAHGTTAIDRRA